MTESSASGGAPLANGRATSYDASYAWRVMWILAGLVTVVLYVEGMLTPSLPTIAHQFGVSAGQASLILSSYIVTGVALSPVVGKLGDIYGKKRVLGVVLVLYAACVSVTGFSPTFSFMVGARAFQGVGLTVFPLGMSLVREEFPREMVPRAQGILSGMFGAGFAVSLPIGAWVSFHYGWRVTYHSAIPFVLLLAILVFLVVRESRYRRPETKVDYVGAAILGLGLALIVLALSEGPTWGWQSTGTLSLFAVGLVLLVPLILYELRYQEGGGEAILNFRLLRERNVMVTNVIGAVSGMGMYLALLSMTYLFQDPAPAGGYGQTILGAGISLVPLALGMLVFAPIAGVIVTRVGARPLTAIGAAIAGVAFLAAVPTQTLGSLLVVEFFIGAGIGILNSGMINLLVLTVDPRDMGLATSMSAVFRNVGSSVGAPLSGSLLSTFTIVFLGFVFPAHIAFAWSFGIAAVAFASAGGFVFFGREVLGRSAVLAENGAPEATAISPAPAH